MRTALDWLYRISGGIAAFCLMMIGVTILAQIICRFFGIALDSTESGGFFLAGTTFLGMAWTLKSGGHIRVELLISRFGPRLARGFDLACCLLGVAAIGLLSWKTVGLVHDSWRFGDLSPGLLAIPFWIPQSVMLAGCVILTIAFLDETVLVLRGQKPGFASGDGELLEEIAEAEHEAEAKRAGGDATWTR